MEYLLQFWWVLIVVALYFMGWLVCTFVLHWSSQKFRNLVNGSAASLVALVIAVAALQHSFQVDQRARDKDNENLYLRILDYSHDYTVDLGPGCSHDFPLSAGLLFEVQLVNNGHYPVNIVDYECVQTDSGFCPGWQAVPKLYSTDLKSFSLPLSLESGEAQAFLLNKGIFLSKRAADVIKEKIPSGGHSVSADSIDKWLGAKRIDYWGNELWWIEHWQERGNVIVVNTDRPHEVFALTLITTRGNRFSCTFVPHGEVYELQPGGSQ